MFGSMCLQFLLLLFAFSLPLFVFSKDLENEPSMILKWLYFANKGMIILRMSRMRPNSSAILLGKKDLPPFLSWWHYKSASRHCMLFIAYSFVLFMFTSDEICWKQMLEVAFISFDCSLHGLLCQNGYKIIFSTGKE